MEQLLLGLLLLLLLGVVVRLVQQKNCPLFGHGAREDTLALHELYRRWAGESGAYIITLQSAGGVARFSLREAEPRKQ